MSAPERAADQHPDAVRLGAVRQLAQEGAGAAAALVDMLADPSWSVRREVVSALAALGDDAAEALCESLRARRDNEARVAATVDALVSCRGELVEERLAAVAQHSDPQVVADVAQIWGRRRSAGAGESLRALTGHADDNVAVAAIEALGRLGGRAAVDALIACVGSNNFFRVFPAIDVLGRSGDPRAVEPLANLLADSRYALEAARALGRSADRRAVAALTTLLTSPSLNNVRVASLALMDLCDRHEQLYGSGMVVQDALRSLLSDVLVRRLGQSLGGADKAEKVAMCRLLGCSRSEAALPFLLQTLDADPEIVSSAGQALVEIGRNSERALLDALLQGDSARRKALLPVVTRQSNVEALIVCLHDPSADVRVLACDALLRVGGMEAVPELFALLQDNNQRVVHAAVSALQALGTAETEPLALRAASSENPGARRAALRVLAYFGYASALPLFTAAIDEGEPRLRDLALQGLALLEQPEALERLLLVAQSADPTARAAAIRALRQAGGSGEVIRRLLKGLSDSDAWVRYYACQALGKLGIQQADQLISALVQDEAGQVRVAAIEALSLLRSPLAVQTLRSFASHPDLDMRRAALVGLGLAHDQASLPVFVEAALSGDSATQLVALSALAASPDPQVVPTLSVLAMGQDESVRTAAINLLTERPGREAADALVALLLSDADRELLLAALATPLEGRVPALQAALQNVDDDHALLLTSCLSRLHNQTGTAALYQTLSSPNLAARKAAVSAVFALATQESRSALEQLANVDPDAEVRRICRLYLAS